MGELRLLICGPNCLMDAGVHTGCAQMAKGEPENSTCGNAATRPELVLRKSRLLYHQLFQQEQLPRPHLAVAFNAGIWGYDTWLDTVKLTIARNIPLLITAYNMF